MDLELIYEYIEELGDDAYFVGRADQTKIETIEHELQVNLPESYKWFLKEFGVALFPGCEIEGNGLADVPSCVQTTIDWRGYGLPIQFVVIENVGEWVYCLDTSRLHNGECPVVDWDPLEGSLNKISDTFLTYFRTRLKESLDMR